MAQVPSYEGGVPQASGGLPTQRSSVTAFSEGGGLAQGLEAIGKSTGQFSDQLTANAVAFQQQDNKAAVDDAFVGYLNKVNDYQYNPEGGYFTKLGKDAVDAYPQALKDLTQLRDDASATLSNKAAQLEFDSASRRQLSYSLSDMARHAATERKSWLVGTSEARVKAAQNTSALNAFSDDQFNDTLVQIEGENQKQGQLRGWSPEQVQGKIAQDTSEAWKMRIDRVTNLDPAAGRALYEKAQPQLTAVDSANIDHFTKSALVPQQARVIADSSYQPTTGNPEDALPAALDRASELAESTRPGDAVFAAAVETQVRTKVARDVAAFHAVQRDSVQFFQGQVNQAEEAGHIPTLDELTSSPDGKAAWGAMQPTSQKAFLNQLRVMAQGPRGLTPENITRYQSLMGQSYTDPKTFANIDVAHDASLTMGQRNQIMNRQRVVVNRKPLNENVTRALSVLSANQLIQTNWPTAADKATPDYQSFVGGLENKLDAFNVVHGRQANDSDIKKMGQDLLLEKKSGGFLGLFQSSTKSYQVPQSFRDDYAARFKKAGGGTPSEEQILDAFARSQ